jgi:hypothetical protein
MKSPVKIITDLVGGEPAIDPMLSELSVVRARLDELERDDVMLLSSDEAPEVVERNYKTWIEAGGRRWLEAHGKDVVRAGSSHVERSPDPAPARVVGPRPDDAVTGLVDWDMLCAIFPDLVLAGLRRIVAQTPYAPGPAAATRPARLAQNADERATLARRHAELVERLLKRGHQAEHLPEEVHARYEWNHRHQMWEADVRMNREYYERKPKARPAEPE